MKGAGEGRAVWTGCCARLRRRPPGGARAWGCGPGVPTGSGRAGGSGWRRCRVGCAAPARVGGWEVARVGAPGASGPEVATGQGGVGGRTGRRGSAGVFQPRLRGLAPVRRRLWGRDTRGAGARACVRRGMSRRAGTLAGGRAVVAMPPPWAPLRGRVSGGSGVRLRQRAAAEGCGRGIRERLRGRGPRRWSAAGGSDVGSGSGSDPGSDANRGSGLGRGWALRAAPYPRGGLASPGSVD
jgi:hypothetical protein